jgi:uncharacterized protein YhbP (UPF0306 family)
MNGNDKFDLLSDQELRERAEGLIAEQNTMTIATAQKDRAWAAPVYYANVGFNFYFFSDPTSRHIQETLESGQASAAIFVPASTWQAIRGIQMSGSIRPLSPGMEALKAVRAYLKKYPFTKEFFDGGQKLTLDAFVKRFRVHLYRFKPSLLYYLDNGIRFSFRQEVSV